jgi:WD40 repeat protein
MFKILKSEWLAIEEEELFVKTRKWYILRHGQAEDRKVFTEIRYHLFSPQALLDLVQPEINTIVPEDIYLSALKHFEVPNINLPPPRNIPIQLTGNFSDVTTICTISTRFPIIVATGHSSGIINIWKNSELMKSWQAHVTEAYYQSAAITRFLRISENSFISGGMDCAIKLWTIDGVCTREFPDTGYITGLCLQSADRLVSSSIYNSYRSRTVRVWDLRTGGNLYTFIPDGKTLGAQGGAHWRYPVYTMVLKDGKIAFYTYNEGGGGRAIVMLDSEKNQYTCFPVCELSGGMVYIEKRNQIVDICKDKLRFWDVPSMTLLKTVEFSDYEFSGITIDGDFLVCIGKNCCMVYSLIDEERICHRNLSSPLVAGQEVWS